MILEPSFYQGNDVITIARQLLGKVLCTQSEGIYTSGIITETEAYAGTTDKASHAFNGRKTKRTEIMFRKGGIAYIYLCYGIHSLFNVVTSVEGNPHAVLIRAVDPLEGVEWMEKRNHNKRLIKTSGIGPGNVSKLLGIHFSFSGLPLIKRETSSGEQPCIWIEDRGFKVEEKLIITGPRVGVDYAGEDALLPYRFRFSSPIKL
ncbi:MAG: DNA-3-methyladenine glycosylase [Bacteroidales bacterium]|nr:DNA-3-methyladenine glycosylase [Bacteroidales bacterium]